MTRDVASRFHNQLGETFVLPEAKIQEHTKLVPGIDGEKMSKSKGNIINIFLTDKKLRKQIMKIKTDSTPLESPKNPETCNLFSLYKLLANDKQLELMRKNYLGGNYGYGHAKQAFFELVIEKFAKEREQYQYYMNNLDEIDKALSIGAKKATLIADTVLHRVRSKIGY